MRGSAICIQIQPFIWKKHSFDLLIHSTLASCMIKRKSLILIILGFNEGLCIISLYIKILVNLMTVLLMWFGMILFDTPQAETKDPQASIIQRVEPGLVAAYDQAKTTIKE
jgi:hypothetical protein